MVDRGLNTWLGLLYCMAVPKDLLIARTYQISPSVWMSGTVKVKSPSVLPGERGEEELRWHVEKESFVARAMVAKNLLANGDLSFCAGAEHRANSLQDLKGGGSSETIPFFALVHRFSRGTFQVAVEGSGKVAAEVEMRFEGKRNTTSSFTFGGKWEQRRRLQIGAGFQVEL
ncbi:hypothetical protein GUITHDRAFT_156658 [Guillardia theta CCMP2712]|uniref:Uncharacterized protein n=2 Tax=Guillardia theta TaxID=55529 RepID=L1I4G8_GUITC|nr:hypothetical protein GUITHDRAFT_156658 [Guillardia theta CCMP2712]EKX31173.1 hypothetical protein GUITHDRAFT_156658 [Guillardia theta CCMP2712]|eukprot:XP_005818153.1 hypothetical protein GUITHDRAFT_156658 [Guillardia theta CCMP2712]